MSQEVLMELEGMERAFSEAISWLNGNLDRAIRICNIGDIDKQVADCASRAGEISNVCMKQIDRGRELIKEALMAEGDVQMRGRGMAYYPTSYLYPR